MEIIRKEKESLIKIAAHVLQSDPTQLDGVVESEILYLQQRVSLSVPLRECTGESLLMCIRHAIRDNVSLDESAGLVYIYPQNVKVGDKWVKIAKYELTPNGKLSLSRQTGNVLDNTQPKLIKENGKVVGGYIEILKPSFPSPRWERFDFDLSDIERWKKFSAKKNKDKGANQLYTSGPGGGIDEGFMKAKVLKHALKNMGTNVSETRGQKLTPLPGDYENPLSSEEVSKVAPISSGVEEIEFEPMNDNEL